MHGITHGPESNEIKRLLQWIKRLVHSPRCTGIRDLSNGVIWCRLMAKLRPGTLASILVINRPANVHDSMHNYMLLESAFAKARIPWYFDVHTLISGNSDELFQLAKSFAEISATNEIPLTLPKPPFKPSQQARRLAGENESTLYSSSTRSPTEPATDELQELSLVLSIGDNPQAPSPVGSEHQLQQKLKAMFLSQQKAMEAYFAEKRSSSTNLPSTVNIKCLCSKCQNQGQDVVNMQ